MHTRPHYHSEDTYFQPLFPKKKQHRKQRGKITKPIDVARTVNSKVKNFNIDRFVIKWFTRYIWPRKNITHTYLKHTKRLSIRISITINRQSQGDFQFGRVKKIYSNVTLFRIKRVCLASEERVMLLAPGGVWTAAAPVSNSCDASRHSVDIARWSLCFGTLSRWPENPLF